MPCHPHVLALLAPGALGVSRLPSHCLPTEPSPSCWQGLCLCPWASVVGVTGTEGMKGRVDGGVWMSREMVERRRAQNCPQSPREPVVHTGASSGSLATFLSPFICCPAPPRPRMASPQQGATRPLTVSAHVARHTRCGFFLSPLRPGFIHLRRAAGSVTYQVLCGLGKKPSSEVDSRVQLV